VKSSNETTSSSLSQSPSSILKSALFATPEEPSVRAENPLKEPCSPPIIERKAESSAKSSPTTPKNASRSPSLPPRPVDDYAALFTNTLKPNTLNLDRRTLDTAHAILPRSKKESSRIIPAPSFDAEISASSYGTEIAASSYGTEIAASSFKESDKLGIGSKKEGHLWIKFGKFRKSWKIYWFCLSQSKLCCYETPQAVRALLTIPLTGSVHVGDDPKSKSNALRFAISADGKSFRLEADSSVLRNQWVDVIAQSIQGNQHQIHNLATAETGLESSGTNFEEVTEEDLHQYEQMTEQYEQYFRTALDGLQMSK